jgi:hypothetical protein
VRLRKSAPLRAISALIGIAAVLGACGGLSISSPAEASSTARARSVGATGEGTVWLCRPGLAKDPCARNLATTSVPAAGPRNATSPTPSISTRFDCFYVYPTASTEQTDNANLEVQPAEVAAAVAQASPFSQVCRVWAPMYRQRTEASLLKGLGNDPAADRVAYKSLLAGWTDYLNHDNDGRPVIFIGHSQGAAMLIRLLSSKVDPNPALRRRVVSAIIAGGNVAVPTGRTVGATFDHLPLCTASGEVGCVIAYSSFPKQPPAQSQFGRPGQGVSLQSGQTATAGVEVACVNPAALGGGAGALDPIFPTSTMAPPPPTVTTRWVAYPDLYTASCQSGDDASWLQVSDIAGPGDTRPVVTETLGPTWGYHLHDINLALGNLVSDVRLQEATYTSKHG